MESFFPKSLSEFIEIFFRRKMLFFIPFISVLVLTAVLYPFLPRMYKAKALVLIEEDKIINPLVKDIAFTTNVPKKIKSLTARVLSWSSIKQLVFDLRLIGPNDDEKKLDAMIAGLRKNIKITLKEDSATLIQVEYENARAELAQLITNAVAEELVEQNKALKKEEASRAIQFIDEQLHVYRAELEDTENSFLTKKINKDLSDAIKQRDLLRKQLNPVEMKLQAELTQTRVELNNLLLTSKESHPLVQQYRTKIAALEKQMTGESTPGMENSMSVSNPKYQEALLKMKALDYEIESLKKSLSNLKQGNINTANVSEQELGAMERDKKVNEDIYNALLKRLKNAHITQQLDDRGQAGSLAIVDPARLPKTPSRPQPLVVAGAGIFFALVFGLGSILVREQFDTSFKSVRDAKNFLDLPFLGYIPTIELPPAQIPQNGKLLTRDFSTTKKFVMDENVMAFHLPDSKVSEQFRLLRTHLLNLRNFPSLDSLIITSSSQGEGKTTTAVNLAVSMAHELGKRILLVDADLRRGGVDKMFGLPKGPGLVDCLARRARLDEVLIRANNSPLTILPSGEFVSTPTRLFDQDQLSELMRDLKSRFDFIIMDTPPVLHLADVPMLANHVSGIALVIQSGTTRREQVQIVQETIEQTGRSNLVGYILTRVESHIPSYANPYLSEVEYV